MHLFRRKNQADLEEIVAFVEGEMVGSGRLQGLSVDASAGRSEGFCGFPRNNPTDN